MLNTRERLVRAAYEVFLQQGFNAVGIDQILRKVGVTKTTFYNHFESKDDLVAAVLRWRNSLWPKLLKKVIQERQVKVAADQIMLLLEARDEIWELPEGSTGPFTRAACEYPSGQGPVRQAIAEYRATLQKEMMALAEATGAKDPAALTRELKLVIGGVAALNLVGETDRPLETAILVLRQTIDRHVPKGPSKRKAAPAARKKARR